VTEKFEILSPRNHIRKRTGMYLGSTSIEEIDRFLLGKWRTVRYVPALNKMIDEIIGNCIDEAIRTKFKHANEITVTIRNNRVTVEDNGRGIPHDKITDVETGETILRPVAAWTRVNAGTSFDSERTTIGANGVGAACVNFMSKSFIGETTGKNKRIRVASKNGALDTSSVVTAVTRQATGTKVQFVPDFTLLSVDNFDDLDTIQLVEDRLAGLQVAFPEIKFKFNGKLVKGTTLKKYAALFTEIDASTVSVQRDKISFFFCASVDGYRSTGYINGVNTRLGGTYNDFITNGVVDELMKTIKRKYKIDVGKSTIKSGLTFVLFARDFADPKYDSQTKERLTNSLGEVKQHYESAGSLNFVQLAKKIMSCSDIIEPIVEAQLAKKMAADKRAATMAQKKLRKVKVAKHVAATQPGGTLFLVEGDSAMGFLINVRNPKTVGAFPLRGVVMNTWDLKPADVLKNKELSELIAVLGLDINNPDSVDNMEYQHVATLADADMDGNHINGLLIAFFYKFWPRLFVESRIHMTRTPIMISTKSGKVEWFYSAKDARVFKNANVGWKHRYIKGLASLTEEEYDLIINQPVLSTIDIDKPIWFEVMFGKESQPRKEWITNKVPEIMT